MDRGVGEIGRDRAAMDPDEISRQWRGLSVQDAIVPRAAGFGGRMRTENDGRKLHRHLRPKPARGAVSYDVKLADGRVTRPRDLHESGSLRVPIPSPEGGDGLIPAC